MSRLSVPIRLLDPISRRELIRIGSWAGITSALGGWPEVAAASPTSVQAPRAKSCIVLFLMGGPPQHSTWDPKPDTTAQIRGEFSPIQTSVPGIQIGELLPKTAKLAEHLCLLRAMRTGDNAHSSSGYYMMTGVPHQPMNRENVNPGAPNNWPNYASIIRRFLPSVNSIPASVRLPHHIWNTDGSVWPGQDAGFLGRANDPWLFRCDPSSPDFCIPEFTVPADLTRGRLESRRTLLGQIEQMASSGQLAKDYDLATRQAFDLLTSEASRRAFDLDRESPAVRDRYGRGTFGQSVLLARRMVESGVRLVQVNWFRGNEEPSDAPCWDSHARETDRLKNALVPPFDQAFSALVEDLRDRRLLDETIVACVSEFGRSPKMNAAGGRDHWGNVFSVALAGGGIRGGLIHGSSDRIGGEPKDGLVTPSDLLATIYHCLGIPPETEYQDHLGRPLPISRGRVIHEVVA